MDSDERHVLIVDDTEEAWPGHGANLIAVERYSYFPPDDEGLGGPGGGRKGPSLLRASRDESTADGQLAATLSLLKRVHARAFADLDAAIASRVGAPLGDEGVDGVDSVEGALDVCRSLGEERATHLAGVVVLFSRRIPLGDPNPERHPLWRLALVLGATVVEQVC